MKIIIKQCDMDDKTVANLIASEFSKNGYTDKNLKVLSDKPIDNGREIKFEKLKEQ